MNAVRRAAPADAEGIARVHVAAWKKAYEGLLPSELLADQTVAKRTEAWKRQLRDPTVTVWVAADNSQVVTGFVAVGPSRDDDASSRTGELYAIYVHPDSWGAGLGQSLFRTAQRALSADFDAATLWVLDGNTRARRFYEGQCWVADGATRQELRGAAVLHEVRYVTRFAKDE